MKAIKGATPDNPDERCNPEPASRAAATYIKKLLAEDFGSGNNQATFAITSFASGEFQLKKAIETTKQIAKTSSVSFWTLLDNKEKLSNAFSFFGTKEVPTFFAAAIVGENPKVFDIDMQPLSTYVK